MGIDWGIIIQQFFSQAVGINAMVFAMAAIGLNTSVTQAC